MFNGSPCTIYDVFPADEAFASQEYEDFWSDWENVGDLYDFEAHESAIRLKTLKQQVFQERGGFLPGDRITIRLPYACRNWGVHPAIVLQSGTVALIVYNLKQNVIQEVACSDATWNQEI